MSPSPARPGGLNSTDTLLFTTVFSCVFGSVVAWAGAVIAAVLSGHPAPKVNLGAGVLALAQVMHKSHEVELAVRGASNPVLAVALGVVTLELAAWSAVAARGATLQTPRARFAFLRDPGVRAYLLGSTLVAAAVSLLHLRHAEQRVAPLALLLLHRFAAWYHWDELLGTSSHASSRSASASSA